MANNLVTATCPNCNSPLQIKEGQDFVKCEYCGTEFLELYAGTSPAMYNYVKAGFDNAKILNSLNVVYSTERKQWVLRSKNDFEYYFWISTYIVKDFDDRTGYRNSQKWLPPIDDAYIAKIKSDISVSANIGNEMIKPYKNKFTIPWAAYLRIFCSG